MNDGAMHTDAAAHTHDGGAMHTESAGESSHAMSDGAMHKTSAGTHTHDDDTIHTESASKNDGIANRPCSMHRQISITVPADSACSVHAMSDSAMHKMSAGVYTHDDGTMHTGSLSKSNRIADQHSSMHG